jgi:dipeptide/tripeptide permease
VLLFVGLRFTLDLPPTAVAYLLLPTYLLLGVLTASMYALLMNLTDPAVAGVQFSTYMGAGNACEAWAVALAGTLAASYGYGAGFSVTAVLSLAALPLLALLPKTARQGQTA